MSHLTRYGLLLAALAAAAPARGANLDKALLDNAPDLLVALKKADIKSVGVLPFAVKRGARPAGYDAAPLSAGMPGRLENALILRQTSQEEKAMKVLRDATATAAKAGVGAWSKDAASFQKLFATKYELAWGDKKLPADAFLTGEVRLTGDMKEAEVVVRYFKADGWKDGKPALGELATFKVKTDRSLLRDVGYNAVVSSRALKRKGEQKSDAEALNDDVIEQVTKEEKEEKPVPDAKQPESHAPSSFAGMKFEVEYDGVKQEINAEVGGDGAKQPSYTMAAPKPGQKVVMYLTREQAGDNKLGVVLRVNGKSTWEEQDAEPAACRRWVFDAKSVGKREDYAGFYRYGPGGKLVCNEWKSLDEASAAASEAGVRAGWIDIDVFTGRDEKAGKDDGLVISTRSMTKKKPATLRELRQQLAKANNMVLSPVAARSMGGLLIGDVNAVPVGELKKDTLGNVVHLGGISIRYLSAEGGKKTDE
ncbi:MAG: hypothetical protein ACRC33_11145 [Gemmataceae bacterium]